MATNLDRARATWIHLTDVFFAIEKFGRPRKRPGQQSRPLATDPFGNEVHRITRDLAFEKISLTGAFALTRLRHGATGHKAAVDLFVDATWGLPNKDFGIEYIDAWQDDTREILRSLTRARRKAFQAWMDAYDKEAIAA